MKWRRKVNRLTIPLSQCANLFRATPDRFGIAHRNYFDIFAGPLEKSREHATGAKFHEQITSQTRESLHAIDPPNRARDLFLQSTMNFRQRLHLFASDVA